MKKEQQPQDQEFSSNAPQMLRREHEGEAGHHGGPLHRDGHTDRETMQEGEATVRNLQARIF